MRIAMISFHTCPLASEEGKDTGGMNVYVFGLAKQLAKQGHVVDMYTRAQSQSNKKIVEISPRLRLIHLKAGKMGFIQKKKLIKFIPEFVQNYLSFIKNNALDYDVIHCHYYLSGLIGLRLKALKSSPLPIIMTFHTLALMKNLVARDEFEKEEVTRIDAEYELTQRVDVIIAPSENEKEYLQYLYNTPKDKICVVPPGLDTSLFKPINKQFAKKKINAPDKSKIILFVGRIEPLKGLDLLMYALKVLKTKDPRLKICLWIVGGDVSQKPHLWSGQLVFLKNLMHLLHISMMTKFIGQQPQTMLPYYYNAAEMVIMPSHYESFGIVTLEAMACGTPVITTNVAGVSNLIDKKHKSLVTTVNNPLLLASQIKYLLTNKKVHTQMSKDLYKKAQEFKWELVVKKIIKIYETTPCTKQ